MNALNQIGYFLFVFVIVGAALCVMGGIAATGEWFESGRFSAWRKARGDRKERQRLRNDVIKVKPSEMCVRRPSIQ